MDVSKNRERIILVTGVTDRQGGAVYRHLVPLDDTAARSTIQFAHRTDDNTPLVRAFRALVAERIDGSNT